MTTSIDHPRPPAGRPRAGPAGRRLAALEPGTAGGGRPGPGPAGVPGLGDLLVLVHRRRLHLHLADVNDGTAARAVEPHGGHVMPGGMYLSWLADEIAPYDFTDQRGHAAADAGCWPASGCWCCWSGCSAYAPASCRRLALYLFCVISVPVAIWWAAGGQPDPAADRAVLGAGRARRVPAHATTGPAGPGRGLAAVRAGVLREDHPGARRVRDRDASAYFATGGFCAPAGGRLARLPHSAAADLCRSGSRRTWSRSEPGAELRPR